MFSYQLLPLSGVGEGVAGMRKQMFFFIIIDFSFLVGEQTLLLCTLV